MVARNDNSKQNQMSRDLCDTILGTYKTIEETQQVVIAGMPSDKQMGTQKIVDEYLIGPQVVRELQKGECVYKAPHSFGKLVLSPYFTDTRDITLPEQKKPQETPQIRQDEGSKKSPEPPEAVF